ncbi:hypothetical protein EKO23_24530 [Nocardioides guangzhouensis]|uniref:Uncharacterized protein n=1 Tax=Nocardioides guangzhouensis TaxID=2497878 RepID=A0A4Q4Z195_9ACTN|nr:hypothetical protein [Nocardioides guangzhouensis]RYP80616.1 hypothetical protein EKO23_24530 [Nocardioides guangzhouensis]
MDIGIPRKCLDDPYWVRIKATAVVWAYNGDETVAAWDYAINRGPRLRDDASRYSPPIHVPE